MCGLHRSSRPEVFCKKGILRNFPKFSGKHLCQGLFFNKVAGLGTSTHFSHTFKRWSYRKLLCKPFAHTRLVHQLNGKKKCIFGNVITFRKF